MLLPTHLLLFLVSLGLQADPSSAISLSTKPIKRLHNYALKHSAGLARDLRVAFQPILGRAAPAPTQRVFCVGSGNGSGTGSAGGNGTTSSTSSSSSSTKGSKPSTTKTSSKPSATSASPSPTSNSSPFTLLESHSGNSFFDKWAFFTGADPTNGIVTFIDEGTGRQNNLVSVNSAGNAVMRVETTPVVSGNRQSIRINTQTTLAQGGLVLMDSVHMPTGCGTWPAWWSNGPNWPQGGEIDILEGVNQYTNNQATIHTLAGCTLSSTSSADLGITGSVVGGTNCAALDTGNQGCGVRAKSSKSFGSGFNDNGGGVAAMLWDDDGVSIWFFERQSIPDDIDAGSPQPSGWGEPLAFWSSASCDPYKFFNDHTLIFDTTLCGDWAGGVWTTSGLPGQEQSCATRTGAATCEEYVRNNGAALNEAYWEVKSVQMYTKN